MRVREIGIPLYTAKLLAVREDLRIFRDAPTEQPLMHASVVSFA